MSSRTRSPAAKAKPAAQPVVRPAINVAKVAEVPQPSGLKDFLNIYWTVFFAATVTAMQSVVEPRQDWLWPPELDLTFEQAKSVLTSKWIWMCWGPLLVGIPFLRSFFKKNKLAVVERSMMMWWWTNIFFFHTGCDLLSGYYQVMPGLAAIYAEMTPAHKQERWSDARLHLDTTYFLEMTVEIPLAILCVILYYKRHPARYVVECFAVAVQFAGAVIYYTPALIRQEPATNWLSLNDRFFGAMWCVVPFLVLRRHWKSAVEAEKNKKA
jgi:hypothetical protein